MTPSIPDALWLSIRGTMYRLERVVDKPECWRLTKDGQTNYEVWRGGGRVRCTCADFEFSKSKTINGLCKHGEEVVKHGLLSMETANA